MSEKSVRSRQLQDCLPVLETGGFRAFTENKTVGRNFASDSRFLPGFMQKPSKLHIFCVREAGSRKNFAHVLFEPVSVL